MQYAVIDGRRAEPQPGLYGQCPLCRSPVIPKCGEIRVHHWAHEGRRRCDHWWEPETAWHRDWKEQFPEAWREIIRHSFDGEKHIADICSPIGRVIEFQHSYIKSSERNAREAFYGDMMWVVDGRLTDRGPQKFRKGLGIWRNWGNEQRRVFVTQYARDGLAAQWLTSSVPVLFDFGEERFSWGRDSGNHPNIWCLLPQRRAGYRVIVEITKAQFIARCRLDEPILDPDDIRAHVSAALEQLGRE